MIAVDALQGGLLVRAVAAALIVRRIRALTDSITFVVQTLGIGGTLASALPTPRRADRTRARELEHAKQLSHEERDYATRHAQLAARRTCYAAFNAGARDCITAMTNFCHALEGAK
nr:hypothetical protein [Streptomyces inhibens]